MVRRPISRRTAVSYFSGGARHSVRAVPESDYSALARYYWRHYVGLSVALGAAGQVRSVFFHLRLRFQRLR